jgi:2-keto-3-deoxy-L-rhamnonate aldolase RhmA
VITQGSVFPNVLKELLLKNEPSYVFTVRFGRTIDIVGIAAASGHQAFYVDLQHNAMSLDTTAQICQAGLALGLTSLVRVPTHDPGLIGRLLDCGAQGIIAPDVNSAEEARAIARACKFPPYGSRSMAGTGGPHTLFEQVPTSKLQRKLDATTLVICMLETPEGIAAAEEIAVVEGVDAVMIGSNDLTTAMRIPGQFTHERLREAFRTTIAACRRAGKPMIPGGIRDAATIVDYIRMGAARCYLTGNDASFLLDGAKRQNAAMRAIDELL